MEPKLAFIVFLHVAYALDVGFPNLAIRRRTEQSSTKIDPRYQVGKSMLAVDGNKRQDHSSCTFITQSPAWWYVQLDRSSHIHGMKIWMERNSRKSRNYRMYITNHPSCGTGEVCTNVSTVNNVMTVTCTGVGKYVVICEEVGLSLCEVEIYGCDKDKYGLNCEKQCGHCQESYCNLNNGYCSKCESGYWGETCTKQCPHNCRNGTCIQSTGVCTGCNVGYYNAKCTSQCPVGCRSNICMQDSGNCEECNLGYWGNQCSTTCKNCKDGSCHRANGTCVYGCSAGFWGPDCRPCNENCADVTNTCVQETKFCDGCDTGYWGKTCNETCSYNCVNWLCTRMDASCINGCVRGFYGVSCMYEQSQYEDIMLIGGFGALIGFVAISVIKFIIFMLRRKLKCGQKSSTEARKTEKDHNIQDTTLSDTDMSFITIEY